ncbi:MAG TPA: hypothetical protein VN213_10485, partial [Solirubrobacteraceae bacterium]|nr:hypothetical protein [Solirubrobacteraceae bacterium]
APADVAALTGLVDALGDAAHLDALDALDRPSRSPVELAALAAKIRAGDYVVDCHAVAGALLDRLVTGGADDTRLE